MCVCGRGGGEIFSGDRCVCVDVVLFGFWACVFVIQLGKTTINV